LGEYIYASILKVSAQNIWNQRNSVTAQHIGNI